MLKRIGGRPTAKLTDYIQRPVSGKRLPFPFSHLRSYFHYSARYALATGIRALGIKAGDTVLLPAYNCGVEIEPFLHFGIRTEFYRVDKEMNVDLADLSERLAGNIKAVMVTHYLGFPQSIEAIRELCSSCGVFLIEDCAHALLSTHKGKWLGQWGDVAVFSLLKTLPVPNGGVLVLNRPDAFCERKEGKPDVFSSLHYIADLRRQQTSSGNSPMTMVEAVSNRLFWGGATATRFALSALRKVGCIRGRGLVRPDSYEYRPELIGWGMSRLSENLTGNVDFEMIKRKRRENFATLLKYVSSSSRDGSFRLLMPVLPEGACPLFFPILINDEGKREHVYQAFKMKGITTHPWWDMFHPSVNWNDYPDARYLKERLFGLPIHQGLNSTMMERIATELTRAL